MRLEIEDGIHDEGRSDVVESAELLWSERMIGRGNLETDRNEEMYVWGNEEGTGDGTDLSK